ncbi:transcriptional attenuator, LytR family [Thermosyntropha lipolytica DSM 11003]|uniref:Transcriptional attenuator, LytR family n=1 Tax=Thermosyntropha lipolytica DSM 11003 TaxID=1123382 RepID=A0A1M5PT81_9FIRM|nr:LCP family protein [Thermosyntropha lipolytica]SHH05157.1 transcriptional attenuator, LytR family [Thermosyntropha lipolytica DSM 11003]
MLGKNRVNVLIMGIDARKTELNSRSDTMILASIDKQSRRAVLIWIPRDTRIEVKPGVSAKINSVNLLKGPEAACRTVGELLNCEVKYYVIVNFTGFARIIDALGGVKIDVETDMYHYDPDPALSINLSQGEQVLSGQEALGYVRYRGGPTADIGRTARQQKFIKALAEQMFSGGNILKLPGLVPELMENVRTNIPLREAMRMAKMAKSFDPANIVTQTLPGYSFTDPKTGASYWEADREIAKGIIDDLFNGKTYEVAKDPPNWKGGGSNRYTPVSHPAENYSSLNQDLNGEQRKDLFVPEGESSGDNLPVDNNMQAGAGEQASDVFKPDADLQP